MGPEAKASGQTQTGAGRYPRVSRAAWCGRTHRNGPLGGKVTAKPDYDCPAYARLQLRGSL